MVGTFGFLIDSAGCVVSVGSDFYSSVGSGSDIYYSGCLVNFGPGSEEVV